MSKMRSPNYPAIGLSAAVSRLREIWGKERRTAVSPVVAANAIGYKSLSGPARTALAALKKYGLLDDTPNGVQISDLGIRVLHSEDGSREQNEALREAALKPEIFRSLIETHSEASDAALRAYLMTTKRFSEEGARRFIPSFRDIVRIAKLENSDYTQANEDEEESNMTTETVIRGDTKKPIVAGPAPLSHSFPIPLKFHNQAVLSFGSLPVDKDDLDRIKKWIELFEFNLTEPTEELLP